MGKGHLNGTQYKFYIILHDLKENDSEMVPRDLTWWCRRIFPAGAEGFLLVVPIEASRSPILPPARIASYWPASPRSDDLRPGPAAARYRGGDGREASHGELSTQQWRREEATA